MSSGCSPAHPPDSTRHVRYTPGELEGLLASAPLKLRLASTLATLVSRLGSMWASIEWAWLAGRAPRLTLPRDSDHVVIGRDPGCDCTLSRDTVSRRHALLLHWQGRWTIEDIGSMNGTRLNGWPVVIPTEVRAGDLVSFGEVTCRVAE